MAGYDLLSTRDVAWRDVEYRREGDVSLMARVYQPRGPGPFPLIIDLHGGAWRQFDRTRNEPINLDLAAHGAVIASLDFRLMQDAPYPADMIDINYAIRWFKAHAADFDASPDLVGGIGVSSGGHQILLAAMRPDHPAYTALPLDGGRDHGASLDFVIVSNAPLDLPSACLHLERLKTTGITPALMEQNFGGPAGLREASPYRMLMGSETPRLPPLLLLQAMSDPMAVAEHSVIFAEAYGREGGFVELCLLPNAGHMYLNPGLSEPSESMVRARQQIKSFIARQQLHHDAAMPAYDLAIGSGR